MKHMNLHKFNVYELHENNVNNSHKKSLKRITDTIALHIIFGGKRLSENRNKRPSYLNEPYHHKIYHIYVAAI